MKKQAKCGEQLRRNFWLWIYCCDSVWRYLDTGKVCPPPRGGEIAPRYRLELYIIHVCHSSVCTGAAPCRGNQHYLLAQCQERDNRDIMILLFSFPRFSILVDRYIYTSTILNKYWCSNHFMWIGNKRSWDLLDRIIAFVLAKVYLNNTQWKLKKSIPLNPHFESLSSSRSALGTDSVAPWNTVFMWALGGAELGLAECM